MFGMTSSSFVLCVCVFVLQVIESDEQRLRRDPRDGGDVTSLLVGNQQVASSSDVAVSGDARRYDAPTTRLRRGVDTLRGREGADGRKKRKKEEDTFSKVLPMFVIPYLVQSALLPMLLITLKFMLLKTFLVGKLALVLIAINAFRHRHDGADQMQQLAVQHYGYNGGDEYGAYVN